MAACCEKLRKWPKKRFNRPREWPPSAGQERRARERCHLEATVRATCDVCVCVQVPYTIVELIPRCRIYETIVTGPSSDWKVSNVWEEFTSQ